MPGQSSGAGGLVRALEIDVRLMPTDPNRKPIWIDHRDETRHWIQDLSQRVVREVLGGVVELENEHQEDGYFSEVARVYAEPSARNRQALSGDLHWLVNRFERELATKFGEVGVRPVVHLSPEEDFLTAGRSGGEVVVPEQVQAVPAELVVTPSPSPPSGGGHYNHDNNGDDSRPRGAALMWMGAALGGALIANVFLLFNYFDARSQLRGAQPQTERLAQLTTDLRLAREALEFEKRASRYEQAECARSIAEHRSVISELVDQCRPETAPPTPAPPRPYPERPNPFEQ